MSEIPIPFRNKYTAQPKPRPKRYQITSIKTGQTIILKENPKKKICVVCGPKQSTVFHHLKYDEKDPLAFTKELCHACNNALHRVLEKPELVKILIETIKLQGPQSLLESLHNLLPED